MRRGILEQSVNGGVEIRVVLDIDDDGGSLGSSNMRYGSVERAGGTSRVGEAEGWSDVEGSIRRDYFCFVCIRGS